MPVFVLGLSMKKTDKRKGPNKHIHVDFLITQLKSFCVIQAFQFYTRHVL